MAGGDGLEIAKEVYRKAYHRYNELTKPYATVIDINQSVLPTPVEVQSWNGQIYAETLRHDQTNVRYNSSFRQLLHVGYKIAAEMGNRYYNALENHKEIITKNVIENIYNRHIIPLFVAD